MTVRRKTRQDAKKLCNPVYSLFINDLKKPFITEIYLLPVAFTSRYPQLMWKDIAIFPPINVEDPVQGGRMSPLYTLRI